MFNNVNRQLRVFTALFTLSNDGALNTVYDDFVPAAAVTADMCSPTEEQPRQYTGVDELTLDMIRIIRSGLPTSCTCLVASHQWNITTIFMEIIPKFTNRFNTDRSCTNARKRHVYVKECIASDCNVTYFRGKKGDIRDDSKKSSKVNWFIVSFTWDGCQESADLGRAEIKGKFISVHFLRTCMELKF